MKLLLSQLVLVRQFLLRWASGGTWLAIAVLLVVAAWGWLDPFGLRQRLDWMVADQFLQHRPAPEVHPDLVLVSKDDLAAIQLGTTDQRHRLARALRQLKRLGARTVLLDVLLLDPGSPNSFFQEEAIYDGIPPLSVLAPEVRDRYLDDLLLADALASLDRVAIPFVLDPVPAVREADQSTVSAMAERLQDQPGLDAASLATLLQMPTKTAERLYEPAIEEAAVRIARHPDAANQLLQTGSQNWPLLERLQAAVDRTATLELIDSRDSFESGKIHSLMVAEQLDIPQFYFAEPARLGFANVAEDSDGRVRRLPLLALWNGRYVGHQALAALAVHMDRAMPELRWSQRKALQIGDDVKIPLDGRGRLTINWPINDRTPWYGAFPQISLASVLQLARYDENLNKTQFILRETVAEIDEKAKTGLGWSKHFHAVLLPAFEQGNLDAAARYVAKFDESIEQVLNHPNVREVMEQAKQMPEPGTPGQPEPAGQGEASLLVLAQRVVYIQRTLPEIKREKDEAFQGLRERLAGKFCLVGDTTTGSVDVKLTPVGPLPGIAIIASAINASLTGKHLFLSGYTTSVLLLLVFAGGLALPFLRFQAAAAGACAVAGLVVTLFGSYTFLLASDVLVSPVTAQIGLFALFTTTTSFRWWNEYQQKQLVRTIFEAQTNATIVERLIEAGRAGVEEVLTPKNRQVTLFFAEIADFEELAKQVAPERLPELLSRTFGTMDKVIKANEGTLDRYQGHALVAFFGAPIYQPDHAQRACRSALECCDTIRTLKTAWQERGLPVPRVHIGLHTGELLVGNITLTTRVDYTIAGENLNVAYRIGELNETYGTEVMISEATLTRCENMIEARELDLVRIKGRREPLRAYELMSAKGQLRQEQLQLRGAFATGLVAFRNRDYAGALSMFRTCRETSPGDRPATVYIERCEKELAATVQVEAAKPGGK